MNFKKIILNITLLITIVCLSFIVGNINVKADNTFEYITTTDGKTLTYKGTTIKVEIPKNYEKQTTEFRGVWVSPFAGDITGYTQTDEIYKKELLSVLDTMEKYNLNAIVFHIRTHNDAFYNTKLAPKSNYISAANFNKWDYLTWFIDECHARGIEFHAWLNPYRISSTSIKMSDILNKYKDYRSNPASKEENILIGKNGAILDPGRPDVKKYLVTACMEIVKKYDIDAIHFDDYFYMAGIDDSQTYELFKSKYNNVDIHTFRRLQIDEFIENLSNTMYEYNIENNRCVQLGISPSGVYRNGTYNTNYTYDDNGTLTSPLSSNTAGYAHYDNPLYSDTKKWIDNEWIDYITPQLYGSFENTGMPYADTLDWWAQVVKYKKVNLYTGIGVYQASGTSDKGWFTKGNPTLELSLRYNQKHEVVDGFCLYQYRTIETQVYNNPDFKKVFETMLTTKAITPEIPRYSMNVEKVQNLNLYKGEKTYTLKYDGNDTAYKYAIYKVEGLNSSIDVNDPNHLFTIVGKKEFNTYIFQEISSNFTYGVVSINQANGLSELVTISGNEAKDKIDFAFAKFNDIYISGNIQANSYFQLIFEQATLFSGNNVTYIIYKSYDKTNWEQVEVVESSNSYSNTLKQQFNECFKPVYYKIIMSNEYGEIESDIIVADVKKIFLTDVFDYILKDSNEFILDIFKLN